MSPSPLPTKKIELMDFCQALAVVLTGKTVSKQDWPEECYAFMSEKDSLLMLHKDDKDYHFIVSKEDIEQSNWVIYIKTN